MRATAFLDQGRQPADPPSTGSLASVAAGKGGIAVVLGPGSLSLIGCTIYSIVALMGGVVFASGGSAVLTSCTFHDIHLLGGGGGIVYHASRAGMLGNTEPPNTLIINCTISRIGAHLGAVANVLAGSVSVLGCTISDVTASYGAVALIYGGSV